MPLKAFIIEKKCDQSPKCQASRACPAMAVLRENGSGKPSFSGEGKWVVVKEKCGGCGICVRYCTQKAIRLIEE